MAVKFVFGFFALRALQRPLGFAAAVNEPALRRVVFGLPPLGLLAGKTKIDHVSHFYFSGRVILAGSTSRSNCAPDT